MKITEYFLRNNVLKFYLIMKLLKYCHNFGYFVKVMPKYHIRLLWLFYKIWTHKTWTMFHRLRLKSKNLLFLIKMYKFGSIFWMIIISMTLLLNSNSSSLCELPDDKDVMKCIWNWKILVSLLLLRNTEIMQYKIKGLKVVFMFWLIFICLFIIFWLFHFQKYGKIIK